MWSALAIALVNVAALAIAGAGAWHAVVRGQPAWPWFAGLAAVFVAFIALLTLLDFVLSWCWRSRRPPAERIGPGATVAMIAVEFMVLLGAPWRMLFYRWLVPDPGAAAAPHPVLLVHGVLCNAGVWATMRRRILAAGHGPVFALSYGPPLASIDDFAHQLAAQIDAVVAQTGARTVTLVAHSMGGLVCRAYLARFGGERVAHVVTIGSPHHGSLFAHLCPGICMAQMRPGNAWLAALPEPMRDGVPVVSLYSPHDSMVAPQRSALLEGAVNVPFLGVGHNALLRDGVIASRVIDELDAVRRAAAAPAGSPGRTMED